MAKTGKNKNRPPQETPVENKEEQPDNQTQIQALLDKMGELEIRISKLTETESDEVDHQSLLEKALLKINLEDVICMDTFSQKVASAINKDKLVDNPIDYVKIDPDHAFQDFLSYAMKVLLSNQQPAYFMNKKNTRASMGNVITLAKVMFE